MPKYTTGEIAKLCGVSVRTVQYYDSRGILIPSELSEGGRRLYSEEDVKRLKVICFLRGLDLPINDISDLLEQENPTEVIELLLDQQQAALAEEISNRQKKLNNLIVLRSHLRRFSAPTVESIGDIAYLMEQRQKMRRLHGCILSVGIIMDLIECGTLLYAHISGNWWPYILGMPIVIALGIWISLFYFKRTVYLCPQCHELFKPSLKEAFWAKHTPHTRKLHCPKCGYHGFCVETYGTSDEGREE